MTILILTHIDPITKAAKLPHIEHIYKHNLDVDVRIIADRRANKSKEYLWKNGDVPLRKWWRNYGETVKSDVVVIIEWDTLINGVLPILPKDLDLVGYKIIKENLSMRGNWKPKRMVNESWSDENWCWWEDIPKLNLTDDVPAVGLLSFGFYMVRRWVLDSICDPKWDYAYEKSIQNELRFPTIAQLEGARIGEINLPYVHHKEMIYQNKPGIYHPIKNKLDL
jgi:hypothetical protein